MTAAVGACTTPTTTAATGRVFTVNSAGDQADTGVNGVCRTAFGTCTLRAALTEANAAAGGATINFAIPGTGPFTIAPATQLPALTNPSGVKINGYSQAGSAANTAATATNARIRVQIQGRGARAFPGLSLLGGSAHEVRGLSIYNFKYAIYVENSNSNRFAGNFVCTNAAGTFNAALDGGAGGVRVKSGSGNLIGGPAAADRNLISGCAHRGVQIGSEDAAAAAASSNTVQNNLVGLRPNGEGELPNKSHGIDVNFRATNNLVIGNVASGNEGAGIEVSHGGGNKGNQVVNNRVGTNAAGTTAPIWAENGATFGGHANPGIRVEGNQPYAGNLTAAANPGQHVITGNVVVNSVGGGIMIDKGVHRVEVRDNRIGVLANGTPAPNRLFGIRIERGSNRNIIGPGNLIAHNPTGIQLQATGTDPLTGQKTETDYNRITGNIIRDNAGLGIDLAPFGQVNEGAVGDAAVNNNIKAPTLRSATGTSVSGTACAGCVVEVYVADAQSAGSGVGAYGEGVTLVGRATAGSTGAFTVPLSGAAGRWVSATATMVNGAAGDTSEFSRRILAG